MLVKVWLVMTEKKYLQDSNGNVYWPMTAYDAVVGLNFEQFKDEYANYQRVGNVVTVSFNNVDSDYTIPVDYQPTTEQVLKIDTSNTVTISTNGKINTTQKLSGIFSYFLN